MAAIHFFTETSKLKTQSSSDAYGPVVGSLTTEYRTTLKGFLNADAKAIAVCQCKVYLQPGSSSNLVNVILVPVLPNIDLNTGFTPVRYFIYRGIKKADILDTNNEIIGGPTSSNGLVAKLWTNFNTLKADGLVDSSVTRPNSKALGWQYAGNPTTDLMEKIIYETDDDHEVISVAGGTEIGEFVSGNEGFEIVLAERMYLPDLANIQAAETTITATAPGGSHIPGNEPITNMRDREKILNYIDPIAWYNLFHDVGVYEDGNSTPYIGFDNIYTTFLTKFATANTLYIDIRNENGYSLNYYKDNEGETSDSDYGMHLQLEVNGVNQSGIEYYTNYWPILTATIPANTADDFNTLTLRFRKLYNLHPLIYADFAHEQSGNQLEQVTEHNKFKEESDLAIPTADWSEDFVFEVPNLSSIGSAPTQIAWVMKLMNIRLEKPVGVALPASVITKDHFMDNAFGPLETLPTFTGSINTQWTASIRKKFIISAEFAGMYQVTTAIDSQNVGYYISRLEVYSPPNSFPIGIGVSDAVSMSGGSSMEDKAMKPIEEYQSDEFNYNVFKKTLVNSGVNTEVLAVEPNNKIGKVVMPGGIGSLLITRSQHSSMLSLASGLDTDLHDILFQFTGVEDELTDFQQKYKVVQNLQLVGLDSNGIYTSVLTNNDLVGDSILNMKSSTAVTNVRIDTKNEIISYGNIKVAIDMVVDEYTTKLNYDNTPDKTVTRINAHHFAYPGKGEESIAFMKAVPTAPYLENIPGRTCNKISNPIKAIDIPIIGNLNCRIRQVYKDEVFSEILHYALTTHNLIMDHNGTLIDFGHLIYGLDCLLHAGVNSQPDIYYQNMNLFHSIDFASFIGDIVSVVVDTYIEYGNSPTNAEFDDIYSRRFPAADHYGDIDQFGLKAAYDYVLANNSNATFNQVFDHYYGATIPADPTTHYSKRFTRFATEWDLIDAQGGWLGNSNSNNSAFISRIQAFSKFFYLTRRDQYSPYILGGELWADLTHSPTFLSSTSPNYSNSHIQYVLDKFYQFIQIGYSNE